MSVTSRRSTPSHKESSTPATPDARPGTEPASRERWPWVLGGLFGVLALVQVWNMGNAPWWRDDEGTYVSQAWAVVNTGELAHYTYWYDHPPAGWLGVAGWAWLTGGFDRVSGVALGREVAALATIAAMPLLYIVARRLGISRGLAAVAVALFILSPLALEHHRVLWMDNLATPLFLGSFALALGTRRPAWRLLAAGGLLGIAMLTKETFLLLAPVIVLAAWPGLPAGRRWWPLATLAFGTAVVVATYPLYALSQGELFQGDGVSLEEGIRFQLFDRGGSGSVFDPNSAANDVMGSWLDLDPWLLILGVASLPLILARPRLRPAGAGLLILVAALVLRAGYLPAPFVVAMLPLAALCLTGAIDDLLRRPAPDRFAKLVARLRLTPRGAVLIVAILIAAVALPGWVSNDQRLLTENEAQPARDARDWVTANVDRESVVMVDDTIWVDLVESGFAQERVIWFYKLDLDSGVAARYPGGYRDLDYLVASPPVRWSSGGLPNVAQALEASEESASFGPDYRLYRVLRVPDDGA